MWTRKASRILAVTLVVAAAIVPSSDAEAKNKKKPSPASLKVIARVNGEDVTKGEYDEAIKKSRRFFDLARDSVRIKLEGKKLDEYLFDREIVQIKAMAQMHKDVLPGMEATIRGAAERIAAGEDFAKVAEEVSTDESSRVRGGDLGQRQGFFDFVHPFNRVALSLKQGEVSEPFLSMFGYHIVKVDKIYPPMEAKPKQVEARHILIRFPGDPRTDAVSAFSSAKVEIVEKKYCKKLPGYCEGS